MSATPKFHNFDSLYRFQRTNALPWPKPHTHDHCFPIFQETLGNRGLVCIGFRCECGAITEHP
jgi:hypothetical protein